MTIEQRVIRREIDTQQQTRSGTVISQPILVDFDGNSIGVWVVDVEIGKNNVLGNLPIKAGASGNRFYAQLGQTVLLRRSTQGRYEVIGPGDRVSTPVVIKRYDLGVAVAVSTVNEGFSFKRRAFINLGESVPHYDDADLNAFTFVIFSNAGALIGLPASDTQAVSTRAAAITPFNQVIRVDAAGNPA